MQSLAEMRESLRSRLSRATMPCQKKTNASPQTVKKAVRSSGAQLSVSQSSSYSKPILPDKEANPLRESTSWTIPVNSSCQQFPGFKKTEDMTLHELKMKLREIEAERAAFLQEGVFDLVRYLCGEEPSQSLENSSWAQEVIKTLSFLRSSEEKKTDQLKARVKELELENEALRKQMVRD